MHTKLVEEAVDLEQRNAMQALTPTCHCKNPWHINLVVVIDIDEHCTTT